MLPCKIPGFDKNMAAFPECNGKRGKCDLEIYFIIVDKSICLIFSGRGICVNVN